MPSLTRSAADWVASLSPWPADGFGLDRMRALLAELGDPQLRYPAIHVVGTNGKSTTTRMTEALLADAGLAVGAYVSPHVRGWSERIRIGGDEADFERAVAPVSAPAAELVGATQFEVADRGGAPRRSPTRRSTSPSSRPGSAAATTRRTSSARASSCSRASRSTTWTCSATRARRSPPRSSRSSRPGCDRRARRAGVGGARRARTAPPRVVVTARSNLALAVAAAEAFLGRPVDPHAADGRRAPGTARAARRAAARDLGRRPQPRRRRLPPAAPAGARVRPRLLDPRATSGRS